MSFRDLIFMRSYWHKIFHWFYNTPYRSLRRAYRASKCIFYIFHMKNIKNNTSTKKVSFARYFYQARISYANKELNHYKFVIYWSLLECKLSIYVLNLPSFLSFKFIVFKIFCLDCFEFIEKLIRSKNTYGTEFKIDSPSNTNRSSSQGLNEIDRINRRLAWIEAILINSEIQEQSFFYSLLKNNQPDDKYIRFTESKVPSGFSMAYESISFVPRSITRTSSIFWAELTGRSGSFILKESRLAKYQALASLQYIGCFLIFPFIISFFSNRWIVEPWIQYWWNTSQSQIFINWIQEEESLEKLRELEELFWLNEVTNSFAEIHTKDLDIKFQYKTVELVAIYNEESIRIISHIFTDIISFATIVSFVLTGRERIAILNSWIQELFYSFSDTTKAFTILLLTDLCIGFHSPHGWEIVIGYSSEHLGFIHDKYVISCFVSTFPVISDTVFKYWIFRHLNRISPSIVATYHTMNE